MALAFVQGTGLQASGSVASVAVAFASNVTAGNLLVACGASYNSTISAGQMTDSQSNTYDLHVAQAQGGPTSNVGVFSAIAGSSAACTVTFDPGSDYMAIGISEYSGAASASREEDNASAADAGTALTTGNIVCSQACVIVGIMASGGVISSVAPATSETEITEDIDASDLPYQHQYRIVAAGTYASTWTIGTTVACAVAGVAFKEAAGGGSPVTVTPGTATLTLTAFAPTVSAPRLVTPGTASLTITRNTPTVTIGQRVTPGTVSLALTPFAPAVAAPRLVTPGVTALTLTPQAPTVAVDRTVTPGVAGLTLTTFAPSVVVPRLVTPGTASLTLTRFVPTVSTGGVAVSVTPGIATLTLTPHAPTIAGTGIVAYAWKRVA